MRRILPLLAWLHTVLRTLNRATIAHAARWAQVAHAACLLVALWPGLSLAVPARTIEREVEVAVPLPQLWAAWTTREGLVSFMAPEARVDLRPGGLYEILFDPLAPAGQRGTEGAHILALQTGRMLSFDWAPPAAFADLRGQRTMVVVRLEAIDEQRSRVRLQHGGWGDGGQWDQAYAHAERTWTVVLDNLRLRFEIGPFDWRAWLARRNALTAPGAKP